MLKLFAAAAPPKVMFCAVTLAVSALLRVITPVPRSMPVIVLEAAMPVPVTVDPSARVAACARETVSMVVPLLPAVGE